MNKTVIVINGTFHITTDMIHTDCDILLQNIDINIIGNHYESFIDRVGISRMCDECAVESICIWKK